MSDIVYDPNQVHETSNLLITQFKTQANFKGLAEIFGAKIQELEAALFQLFTLRGVNTAFGAQLDLLGAIVGVVRGGLDDTDYSTAIRAEILLNISSGTIQQLLSLMYAAFPGYVFTLHESYPADFTIEVHSVPTNPAQMGALVHTAKPAGVGGYLVYSIVPLGNTFTYCDSNDSQPVLSNLLGYADSANPGYGGHYASSAGSTFPATSTIGIDWTAHTSTSAREWEIVVWSPELEIFCAVAIDGTSSQQVMTSPDGTTWTVQTVPSAQLWRGLCWASGLSLFCAVAFDGSVMTSPDGVTWTLQTAASVRQWISVCYSSSLNLLCAVAFDGSTANQIMTSPDGVTWTSRTSPSARGWNSVCWSSDRLLFCAVSYDGTVDQQVMTSPDGVIWTSQTSPSAQQWESVCWASDPAFFVAVAFNGNASQQIMTSPDGVTWTSRTAPSVQQWRSVCYSPALLKLCAVSFNGSTSNQVMTSS